MNKDRKLSFKKRKQDALIAAKELCYKEEIIKKIKRAKSDGEITRALMKGRKQMG